MFSGHLMASSSVATILYLSTQTYKRYILLISIPFLTLIAWSRCHVGAHLPEQVILGCICGIIVSMIIYHYRITEFILLLFSSINILTIILYSFLLSSLAICLPVIEYIILSRYDDPMYSITLSKLGCDQLVNTFSASTTPFMAIVRNAGVIGGGTLCIGLICSRTRLNDLYFEQIDKKTKLTKISYIFDTYIHKSLLTSTKLYIIIRSICTIVLLILSNHLLSCIFNISLPMYLNFNWLNNAFIVYISAYLHFFSLVCVMICGLPLILKFLHI
jgi:hypothetical protein